MNEGKKGREERARGKGDGWRETGVHDILMYLYM